MECTIEQLQTVANQGPGPPNHGLSIALLSPLAVSDGSTYSYHGFCSCQVVSFAKVPLVGELTVWHMRAPINFITHPHHTSLVGM